MKRKLITICTLTLALVFASCGKWLDVLPESQLPADKVFESEDGFYSSLAGLYIAMSSNSSYGKAMTISQMEVAGQTFTMRQAPFVEAYPDQGMFNCFATYSLERDVRLNTVETALQNMWLTAYNVIANANLLITNLKRDEVVGYFESPAVRDYLLGEALAIRAYNHFDMVRIFQPPYLSQEGKTAKRIPYKTSYGAEFSPSQTSEYILGEIATDLETAASYMKDADPISSGKTYTHASLKGNRRHALNYYAVKALQARVYLYMGENKKAYDAAMEVINASDAAGIRFITRAESQATDASSDFLNRSCPMENIFGLWVDKIGDNAYYDRYTGFSYYEVFRLQSTRYPSFYSSTADYRYMMWKKGTGTNMYFNKYERPSNPTELAKYPDPVVAMLRLGEMYLIAAEGAAEAVSVEEGVRILKLLQTARNGGITTAANKTDLLAEIMREYRRELIGEGQVFYAYKRTNAPTIEKGYLATGSITMDAKKYTPDIPAKEFDAGRQY